MSSLAVIHTIHGRSWMCTAQDCASSVLCCIQSRTTVTVYSTSHRTRDHRWPCIQFNCSSCLEQFANGSAVFRVIGHFLTPPENWTVRAFLQLTQRLSNDFTAAWLTFTSPQLFAVAATLKSIDYNVAMTFILNNNNYYY